MIKHHYDYINKPIILSNNDISLLNNLVNKKRFEGKIYFEISIHKNKYIDIVELYDYFYINKELDNYDKINIVKKYDILNYIFTNKIISIFLWQLKIISDFFINNKIKQSFNNLCKYNNYLVKGGYEIDRKIFFEGDKDLEFVKKSIIKKKFIKF